MTLARSSCLSSRRAHASVSVQERKSAVDDTITIFPATHGPSGKATRNVATGARRGRAAKAPHPASVSLFALAQLPQRLIPHLALGAFLHEVQLCGS